MAGTKGKVGGRDVKNAVVERTCADCGASKVIGQSGNTVRPVKRCTSNGKGTMVFVCSDEKECKK